MEGNENERVFGATILVVRCLGNCGLSVPESGSLHHRNDRRAGLRKLYHGNERGNRACGCETHFGVNSCFTSYC